MPTTSVSASALASDLERLGPVAAVRDELRDHRVVREPDLVTLLDARVHPQAAESAL